MSAALSPLTSPAQSQSPSSDSNGNGAQLTPRSKIKALLAGLDDSDDEDAPVATKKDGRGLPESRSMPKLRAINPFAEEDSSDEVEEDAIVAPRGRLAARLQAETKASSLEKTSTRAEVAELHNGAGESRLSDEEQSSEDDQPQIKSTGLGRFLKRKRPAIEDDSDDITTEAIDLTLPADTGAAGNANVNLIENEPSPKRNRFAALVEKKRAERLAKEAAEEAKKAEKVATQKKTQRSIEVSDVDSSDSDDEAGVRLTQKTRPARKAGKKAMEEMTRETQRISRNMQLAHEAKTKKKITKESLLARFKPAQAPIIPASSSTTNSSLPNSDTEGIREKHTPLTSPERTSPGSKEVPTLIPETSNLRPESDVESASAPNTSAQPVSKGKGRAVDVSFEDLHPELQSFQPVQTINTATVPLDLPKEPIRHKELKQRPIRLIPPMNPIKPRDFDDSGDDLEVVQSKALSLFDNLPAKKNIEGRSAVVQRALAQIPPPSKTSNKDKSLANGQDIGWSLMRQARQQAAAERAERLEVLRSKGVIIRTADEIQQDQIEVEDLLAKAREEEAELTKREKEATKKEKQANGEDVEDSSDDEDYEENQEEDDADVDLSGSENASDEENDIVEINDLVDNAAEEDSEDEEQASEVELEIASQATDDAEDDQEEVVLPRQRRRNAVRVVDDEDEDTPDVPKSTEKATPIIPCDSPGIVQNPFGPQGAAIAAPMGLTQAFAATMADSQASQYFGQQDSLVQLKSMPSPKFANIVSSSVQEETQQQGLLEELGLDLHLTQTQAQLITLPTIDREESTQLSEMPDPTQDAGFQISSPAPVRFATAPISTIDTVLLPQDSPSRAVKKRGRLVRKEQALAAFSDEEGGSEQDNAEDDNESSASDNETMQTAFNVMQKAAEKTKGKQQKLDKKNSEAKEMFEEQAQESEDEYAGLGGASDDSEGEEDEEIRKMLDEGEVDVNERKIAAYFAEKERNENEAAISKLYKDINTGALRRKRGAGADFDDLDDSDDDHAARQARKRRDFAKMRKALLDGDSNIVKIAEDPKKQAFLRAIEDRDDQDEDLGYLDSTPRDHEQDELQSQEVIPDSQAENRPPGASRTGTKNNGTLTKAFTNPRRTALGAVRKPMTLADIRDSVSFLTEGPDSMFETKVGPSMFDASSDLELEVEEPIIPEDAIGAPDESQPHNNPRRTGPRDNVPKFVDRLSLKRQESSASTPFTDENLAFHNPNTTTGASFKPPTLLRKATSSFSTFSHTDEHGISTNNNAKKSAATEEPDVKGRGVVGGSKRSSVNWMARENERKAAREKKFGKEEVVGGGKKRMGSGLVGLLGKGGWE